MGWLAMGRAPTVNRSPVPSKCKRNCLTCNKADISPSIKGNYNSSPIETNAQSDQYTPFCKVSHVIYAITCGRCGLQYVGQTSRKLHIRINEHRSSFRTDTKNQTYFSNHFCNSDCCDNYVINILETCDAARENINTFLLEREHYWITKLKTQFPFGLNTTDRRFNGNTINNDGASTYSCFQVNRDKPKKRGRRKPKSMRTQVNAEEFIYNAHMKFTSDPKSTLNNTHFYLMSCSKTNLRKIYKSCINRQTSLIDPFIRDICSFRLQKDYTTTAITTQGNTNKRKDRPAIYIEYCNKLMDEIRFTNLFRMSHLIKNIPQDVEKDNLHPSFRHTYKDPFGLSLFNYKNAAIELAKIPKERWKTMCYCNKHPQHIDKNHGHVITGDMTIINNHAVYQLLEKGPKFRYPEPLNLSTMKTNLTTSLSTYVRNQIKKQPHNKYFWLETEWIWMKNLDEEIERIRKLNRNNTYDNTHNKELTKKLCRNFIVTTVDKASQNYSLTCKYFYLHKISEILENQGNNPTYVKTNMDEKQVDKEIKQKCLQTFNIKVEDDQGLPFIQLVPKFHKDPVDFRTIIASNRASTKIVSTLVCNALKLVQDNMRKYCKVIYDNCGINMFWIIDNNASIRNCLEGLSKDKNACRIQTYDFGQMYTNLQHEDIINAMNHVLSIFYRRIKYIWVNESRGSFYEPRNKGKHNIKIDKIMLMTMIEFVIKNTYFRFGNDVFQQIIGIPMGTTCAPFLANLTLFSYEFRYLSNKLKNGQYKHCKQLNNTFRYIDDITSLNNNTFELNYKYIYPNSLTLKKVNDTDNKADILDITVHIADHIFHTCLFDKRRTFNFKVNVFPHFDSDLSNNCKKQTLKNEIHRIFKISSNVRFFKEETSRFFNLIRTTRNYPRKFIYGEFDRFLRFNSIDIKTKYRMSREEVYLLRSIN